MHFQKLVIFYICLICIVSISFSQSYNDGPIILDVKLREVQGNFAATDESLLGVGFAPDELTFQIWTQDNLGVYPWTGGSCLQDNNFTPTLAGTNSMDFNTTFANFTFPTTVVPQYLDFKVDTWEDDIPSDGLSLLGIGFCQNGTACTWEDVVCCGITLPFGLGCGGIETGDDYRCDADPFYQGLPYRNGPPCQWYSHGYMNGSCSNSSIDGYYKPRIETYWRYTKGTSFANSIDLGTLTSGTSLIHFNSNECYANYYPNSTGNDVIYSFNVNNPTGLNVSLCGVNGAQYDSYLYLVKDTANAALHENDNYCANQSEFATALCDIGTYYVVVDATSASELGTFTLIITEDPTASFASNNIVTDVNCNNGDDGQINTMISGGYPPYVFSWFDASMTPILTSSPTLNITDSLINLSADDYILHITDNNNCTLIDTIIVNEPSPLALLTSSSNASCNGYSDGTLDVLVSGGTPSYSYSWNTNPVQNNANAVFVSSGTYLLTVTDGNNCLDTISETISEPLPVPVAIISSSTTVCVGGSINLQATGALNYSWSPSVWLNSTTTANVTSTPNDSLDYIVTGTDINGCFNTDTIHISVIQSLLMTSSPSSSTICEGENDSISVSGASSYIWFPANGLNNSNSSNVVASPQNTTNYMVIGTDNFGCADTIYVNVDVLDKPMIGVTNSPSICKGESVSLVANGANNYNWLPSTGLNSIIGSTVTANPDTSTSYTVIGTATNGCSDTISTVVSVSPNPTLNTFPTSADICKGDTVMLFVDGASTYIWNPSAGLSSSISDTVQAFPLANVVYNILGIDSLGCTDSSSIYINVNNLPSIDVTSPKPEICIGETVLLTATGGIHYSWQPSSSLNLNVGNVVSADPTINTVYMVTGTDMNACSSWDTISISVNPLPILSVNSTSSTICNGESVTLDVFGADSYVWAPSLGLNTSLGNSVIASPNITTSYWITATDLNGCSDIISSHVIVNSSPNLSFNPSNASICEGATLQIQAFGANTYTWSPSFGLNTTTSNIVQASPLSSITYTVVGVDGNNCIDSIDFQLLVGIPPIVTIDPPSIVICHGESVTLNASGANTYQWSPFFDLSSSIGESVVATPNQTQSYDIIGTDLLNCQDTANVVISVIPLPNANVVSGGGTVCSGDSTAIIVEVTGNPDWNLTYSIDGSVNQIISSTNPIIIYSSEEGTYTIPFISDANGCSNVGSGAAYIDIINSPQADINFFPKNLNMLDPEVNFINNSIFANMYLWEFGDNTPNSVDFEPVHYYDKAGVYQVALLAHNGPCTDTAFVDVVIDPYFALYIPNIFTPNSDGINDKFEPKGVGIDIYEIFIFNKWGNEIFKSNDILDHWDGGEGVPGVYTYLIRVVDKTGELHKKTGSVLIE